MLDTGRFDPSGFSPATYDATIEQLRSGMRALTARMAQITPTLDDTLGQWWVPGLLADGLTWCADRLQELGRELLATLGDLLEGAAAPALFFVRAFEWVTEVGPPVSGVAATTHPNALRAPLTWTGEAASTYRAAVAGQSPAAAQVQSVSGVVAASLCACAAAGLALYVALGVILAKFLTAMVAAIAALGSVVLSWAGLLVIVEEAAVNTGMVVSAVAAFTAAQGAAALALVNVTGAARSQTSLPHGHWPAGTA
ncbi:hypothetical protein [Cellulomonas persica]|uniref:Uncharacterized protein n=1 Tax=Cellulomonas persica TaxID=76861 RepID=A0A510UUJ3_9CELL|nr:hypothetical protein [Cellulomonas persica]GEK18239.1 hypothetical protein CPE01_19720 [Cellulomonas persica]